jgi:hypothetical protein
MDFIKYYIVILFICHYAFYIMVWNLNYSQQSHELPNSGSSNPQFGSRDVRLFTESLQAKETCAEEEAA